MLIDKLTEEELELIDAFYYPPILASALFSSPDGLHIFNEDMLNIRLGQYPLLPYGSMMDDDPNLTQKELFNRRKNASEIYCFGGRKFGKCEDIDNLCLTASGEYIRFGDLIGQEKEVISFNESTLKFETSIASFHDNGIQDVIKITTKSGYNITVTENHPLYTDKGFKIANEILFADSLAVYNLDSIIYDKVKFIEYIKDRPTVAVWVPNNNTYISNNIISHNTFVGILISIVLEAIYCDYKLYIFSTYDGQHTAGTMGQLASIFKWHPILKLYEASSKSNPSHTIDLKKNGWHLDGINMDTDGGDKNAGEGFIGKHSHVMYIDEATRETDTVKQKRKDAGSELGCIAENSKILMSDLTTKNIQDVKIGDEVLGWDEEKNCIVKTMVLNTINSGIKDVIKIQADDHELYLTPNHKLVDKNYNWNQVSNLIFDDVLCYKNSLEFKYIECIDSISYCQVYDLTTETHNFIANGFVVHNSIDRRFGMTDLATTSPAGLIFYNKDKQKWIMNVPQYINPLWDETEKQDRIKEYGGEHSEHYRVYVKGEVVNSARALLDMQRIRDNSYNLNKRVKLIEISKDNMEFYKDVLYVERSKTAEVVYISADIGDKGQTDIKIWELIDNRYRYKYNVILYARDYEEQAKIFHDIITKTNAKFVGMDVTDGTGRAVIKKLEELIDKDSVSLIPIHFRVKYEVGKEHDQEGNLVIKNGNPVPIYEDPVEYSVRLIREMLYAGNIELPVDEKLDAQLNRVEGIKSSVTQKFNYRCNYKEDHSYQSLQVFVLMIFRIKYDKLMEVTEESFNGTIWVEY